ncbi:unnamed protein product [Vitrella brassicaformis CCMP3155]|uniref:Uncharacterized protein n=1 Tax=Vitrella brassicaformis (strain CCMP3155) TaxID=1169540 RepID=A0A0G4EDI8_VITBC|nr:unnamed protein product [Vitrella brassicaformis CCMP3155]|eukprot:CEL93441.1 unnamed protein product [Vitrella brassicaformis CCMP3155]
MDQLTLWAPLGTNVAYLYDSNLCVAKTFNIAAGPPASGSASIMRNGWLLRAATDITRPPLRQDPVFPYGGRAGILQMIEWEFNTTKFERGRVAIQHHEAIELPNGNILYLLWVVKDYAEAIQAGRDPARDVPDNQNKSGYLLTEEIVEVTPVGKKSAEEVWRWRMWDHLIQDFDRSKDNYVPYCDHPDDYYYRLDINIPPVTARDISFSISVDWLHWNSLDYNEQLDQIMISSRHTSEIYVIDRSITTAEAATSKGDFLFRYGRPFNYRADPFDANRVLYTSHSAKWSFNDIRFSTTLLGAIKEARCDVSPTRNFVLLNNGCLAEGSCCQEFRTPEIRKYGRPYGDPSRWVADTEQVFQFDLTRADFVSSCQRLAGGKYLVSIASPRLVDATDSGEVNRVCPSTGNALRAWRYSTSYSGIRALDVTCQNPSSCEKLPVLPITECPIARCPEKEVWG